MSKRGRYQRDWDIEIKRQQKNFDKWDAMVPDGAFTDAPITENLTGKAKPLPAIMPTTKSGIDD